jgi:teichuronic acid biosynthesis glycosyltransferase TuaH
VTGKDIIMVANQPWDDALGSNCKNIALELAKENRVLHVNPALDRKVLLTRGKEDSVKKIKDIIDGKLPAVEHVEENIWVLNPDFLTESINWIPVPTIHDLFNRYNNYKFAQTIRNVITSLSFSDYIIFNDNVIARAFYLREMLQPLYYIYYIRDYLISQPYYKKHGCRLEKKLIEKSDMILANSLFLKDYAAQFNQNAHYVGQGCELDIFNPDIKKPRPEEFKDISTPVIGYIGFLTALRLDINLIEFIASTKKEWTIVLVGPEDQEFKNSRLHEIKNIIFAGNKSSSELPQYVQHFDVCINPQLINELTIGNYPRKIDEYLAMGKPTVATKTKAMEIFSEYCFLATNKEEYVLSLEKALTENNADKRQSRIDFARSHNWVKNVKDMCHIIENNSENFTSQSTVLVEK